MSPSLEYHSVVRRIVSPAVAFLSASALALFLILPAFSQINGAPASVTSPGFGGRAINGPPASVTSLGPQGFAPTWHPPLSAAGNGSHHDRANGHRHHWQDSNYYGPVWYAVPYGYDYNNVPPDDQSDAQPDENSADYQGGPTIFDRRGSGPSSYIPPVKDAPPAHSQAQDAAQSEGAPAEAEPPLPATLLVFKDGRTLEISNYAIVGPTLFDLTAGHRRKIPLDELDLEATRRQNEERGVTFELPQAGQGG